MAACSFAVEDYSQFPLVRRGCNKDAFEVVGGLPFCWQHKRKLLEAVAAEILHGEPDPGCRDAELRRVVRDSLYSFDQSERERKQREVAARRRASSVVYFVERDGFVKIGTTTNLRSRLTSLGRGDSSIPGMTVGPVRLLAQVPGDRANEQALHRKHRKSHFDREWFLLTDELWSFITDLKGYTGEPRRLPCNVS